MEDLMAYWPIVQGYLLQFLLALLILIVGFFIAGRVKRLVLRLFDRQAKADQTVALFAASIAHAAVVVITIVITLAEFGVETASLIALLGAMGLAVGFALQGTLSNVAAGVMLLVLRPFKVGDFIEAGSTSGTVEEVGIFQTQLRRVDGVYLSVPNGAIWTSPILNFSRNPTRRIDLIASVAYEDDHRAAADLLDKLVRADTRVLADPAPQIFVAALGESSVDINVRCWVGVDDFWQTSWDLTSALKVELEGAGYTIPFPQRDIHMISADT